MFLDAALTELLCPSFQGWSFCHLSRQNLGKAVGEK